MKEEKQLALLCIALHVITRMLDFRRFLTGLTRFSNRCRHSRSSYMNVPVPHSARSIVS